jgi:tetratricopeptide (TPR) repeat protein
VLREHRHRAGQAKKYDEAEAAYKKAIELKPDFAEAYNGLANVYNAQKKFDLAAEASKKAMELIARAAAGGAPGAAPRRRRQRVRRSSTRASFSGTPARFPRRRRSSSGGEARSRTWPTRATGSAWRWSTRGDTAEGQAAVRDVPEARADRAVRRTAKAIVASIK